MSGLTRAQHIAAAERSVDNAHSAPTPEGMQAHALVAAAHAAIAAAIPVELHMGGVVSAETRAAVDAERAAAQARRAERGRRPDAWD